MDNYGAKIKLAIGLLIVAVFLVLFSLRSDAATPPSIISYQGKILVDGAPTSTPLEMNFKLFSTSTGGTNLYSNTSTVIVSSGLFSVLLGESGPTLDPNIFRLNSEMYLEVTVEGQVLSPRKRIVTVPYAFNAKYLDGYGVSLTPTNTNYIPVADSDGGFTFGNVTTTGDLYVSGTIRAGQICDANGNNCYTPSVSNTPIQQIVTTSAMYNGNVTTTGGLTGYVAGNAICNARLSGSHMCSAEEIIYLIRAVGPNPLFNGLDYAWVSNGPPGYLAPSNDCNGWKSSADNNYGPFWEFATSTGGRGVLSPCDQLKPLACCK